MTAPPDTGIRWCCVPCRMEMDLKYFPIHSKVCEVVRSQINLTQLVIRAVQVLLEAPNHFGFDGFLEDVDGDG